MKKVIYDDFYFNGKKLSEMNGVVISQINTPRSVTPGIDIITKKIPGMDGKYFERATYQVRTWTEEIYFKNIDIRKISAWLSSKEEKDFYYIGDTALIKTIVVKKNDIDIFKTGVDKFSGVMTVEFISHDPYYGLINSLIHEFTTVGVKEFENDGNVESFPFIRFDLVGTQNIKFRLNDKIYEIKDAKDFIEIDTRIRTITDSVGNKRQDFYSEETRLLYYPILLPGENTFELLLGSVEKVTINCKSRFI